MLSEKQHIDDFFRRKEEAFTPDDQPIEAHWQQMRAQLADPEPKPVNAKTGSNISRHFNKFLGALITVIIIAVLAINPFRSHKHTISKTKRSATAAVTPAETVKQDRLSDSLPNTTINAARSQEEQVAISKAVDYGLHPQANLPVPPPDKEKPDAYALLQAFYKQLEKEEQGFYIRADRDTTLTAKEGTRLFVPANALITKAGPVKGQVKIVVREYYHTADIIAARLHTTSNGQQLITGGMLHISAEQDGEPVMMAPQKAITVNMPTENYDNQMQLFSGQEMPSDVDNSSTLDWLPVGPFQELINFHGDGRKIKKLNLFNVEPFSVSYGKKTIARFYLSERVVTPKRELIARLKGRFGDYYDVIKIRRVRKNKNYGTSADGNPYVIDSTFEDTKAVLASKKSTKQDSLRLIAIRKQDSFNLEQQVRLRSTYSFALTNFGWYNCDKFSNDPRPKVICKVNLPEAPSAGNHVSLLVFTRYRSVIPGYYNGEHQDQYYMPEGEPVLLITVAVTADKVVSNIHPLTTSNTVVRNLVFEPTTAEQFKQKLQSLFASQQQ